MKIKINAIAIAKNDEVKENSNYIIFCCDETFFCSHSKPDPKLNISRWLVICIINYKRFALARTKPFYVLLDSQRKKEKKKKMTVEPVQRLQQRSRKI